MVSQIINKLQSANIEFEVDVDMSQRTWIHRGCVVPLYILPHTVDELQLAIRLLTDEDKTYKVIGHTSNIYMMPTYVVDAVVCTRKLGGYTMYGDVIQCDCGANMARLAAYTVECGYKGFEGFVGLPGTVGAAVVNNASCYGSKASEHLVSAKIFRVENGEAEIEEVGPEFFEFSHRNSSVKSGKRSVIILSLKFQLHLALDKDCLRSRAEWNKWHRETHQEGKARNLGSVYSMRYPKRVGLQGVGVLKFPLWAVLKLADRLFIRKYWYQSRRTSLALRVYGYEDLAPYVSSKNDNCFIWRDENADSMFERYQRFMNASCELGRIEIEILK